MPTRTLLGSPGRTPALRRHTRRASALRMAGDLNVQVQSVTSSPMNSNNCVQDVCNQALGFVTCKVTGGKQLLLQEAPLANSYYAVGSADGVNVIVPCKTPVEKGSTITVPTNLAIPVPSGWSNEQAGLFPPLCILFLQNMMLEGVDGLSTLKGKTVVVTGGLGPAASVAMQLAAASGAYVVATGTGGDTQKLMALGAHQVIDYKKEAFYEVVPDIYMVIDGLGDGQDATGLRKQNVKYVSVMHPAVALVVREGLWNGGRALQRHMSGEDEACVFEASEEAMLLIKSAVDVLAAVGVAPSLGMASSQQRHPWATNLR